VRDRLLVWPYIAYVGILLGAPLLILAIYSFWEPAFFSVVRRLTTSNYVTVLEGHLYISLLLKSLGVGLLVSVIMTVLGFVVAYAITFKFRRFGKLMLLGIALSLLASYIVRVYAWSTILGANGLFNGLLIKLHLIHQPLGFLFFGYFAIVVTLVYVYLPIVVLVIYGGLQDIDPSTLEAARDLGASRTRRLLGIVVPQADQALKAAFVFGFILATTDYITPMLVGGTSGEMVGAVINDQFIGAGNFPLGGALAFVTIGAMFLIILLLAGLGRLLRADMRRRVPALVRHGRRETYIAPRLSSERRTLLRTLVRRFPYAEVATFLILLFLAAPLIVVIVFSFNKSPVPSLPFTGFTVKWYSYIVHATGFAGAAETSAVLVGIAVAGGTALGVPMSFALARHRDRGRRVAAAGAIFGPVIVPGVVIGVALLSSATLVGIQLGVAVTALAHVLLVTPYVIFVVRARLSEMDVGIEEAARDLGARPRRVFRDITLPLIATSVVGGALLAAAVSMDEILVTNFTIGAQSTVPLFVLGQITRTLTPGINAVAVMVLGIALLIVAVGAGVMQGAASRGIRGSRG
jgi:spermidine/putrescine transport system permease protein